MIGMVNNRLTEDGLPPAITTDIICGFPTETEEDFERTFTVASEIGYLHMHIFPYSVRTGTAAARWSQLPSKVVRDRVNRLLELETKLSFDYRSKLLGRTVQVMLEQHGKQSGHKRGRCEHYTEISLLTQEPIGSIVEAKVTQVQDSKTVATPSLQII